MIFFPWIQWNKNVIEIMIYKEKGNRDDYSPGILF